LNSPFTVTVLGGIILSLISLGLQYRATKEKERSDRFASVQDKKHAMMGEFALGMTLYMQSAPDVRLRGLFFVKNKGTDNKEALKFTDGRTWIQTVERYEQCLAQLNKLQNPDALCAKASAVFETQELITELASLDGIMDKYNQTSDSKEFNSLCRDAPKKLEAVIAIMGKELKNPPPK